MANLFEVAARKKYRFETKKGSVATEDLWDMPLQSKDGFNLDVLAVSLQGQTEEVKSFVKPRATGNTDIKNKLDIVVHVIETKLAEADAREKSAANKEKKEFLLSALKKKQNDALLNMSEEELQAKIAELS